MQITKLAATLGLAVLAVSTAYAASLQPTTTLIPNISETMTALKTKTSLPVLFPEELPAPKPRPGATANYYLSSETAPDGNRYMISVDLTPNCKGAKYCSAGSISAVQNQAPQVYAAMDGQDLTTSVKLNSNTLAYYTPAHAAGDFWPARLEWRDAKNPKILYRLVWAGSDSSSEQALVQMARKVKSY